MATVNIIQDLRPKKNGSAAINLVVRCNGYRLVFATGINAMPEEFDTDMLFSKKAAQYKVKNVRLNSLKSQAEKILIENRTETMSKEKIKNLFLTELFNRAPESKTSELSLVSLFDEFISLKDSAGTKKIYLRTYMIIQAYAPDVTVNEINVRWLTAFDKYLKDEKELKTNTRAIHMRNIRAVFNYAIDEELTACYPFRKFSIKQEQTKKRSLTVEQLRQIRDYNAEEFQERYRDMFMLMFFLIGINVGDMLLLKHEDYRNGRIEFYRQKTGKLYSIKVEPEADEIIKRYSGKNYLLNVLDYYTNYSDFNKRMSVRLKQLGPYIRKGKGGEKIFTPICADLSSYWARHTWATIAASLDVPKEVIAAALGHSGNTVTDIYIKFDPRKVDDANRKVIDYLTGKTRKSKNKKSG